MTVSPYEAARNIGTQFGKVNQGIQQRQENSFIGGILEDVIASNDPQQINQAYLQILKNVKPENQKQALAVLEAKTKEIQQKGKQTQRRKSLVQAGFPEYFSDLPDNVLSKMIKNDRNPVDDYFQKKIIDEGQKIIEKAEQYRPLLGNINEMRNISKDFSGVSGSLTGRTYGTKAFQSANDFEAMSNTIMEPVFELYNPRGVLAQQKVELLRRVLKPNWNDTQQKINAKLNAIEKLASHKVKYGDKVKGLFRKYGGNIPTDDFYDDNEDDIINKVYEEVKNFDKPQQSQSEEPKKKESRKSLDEIF